MPNELLSTEKPQFSAKPLDQYLEMKWPVCLVWRAALAEKLITRGSQAVLIFVDNFSSTFVFKRIYYFQKRCAEKSAFVKGNLNWFDFSFQGR